VGLISTFLLAFGSYFIFMRGSDVLEISRKTSSAHVWNLDSETVLPLLLSLAFIGAGLTIILLSMRAFRNLLSNSYRHALHFIKQFKEVLKVYYHHPAVFMLGLVITLILQSGVILSYWGIGRNLGLTAAVTDYFVFFPMAWAFSSLPISIAGIGILEGGVVFLFVKFSGADPESAIALALCQRLTWLAASVPGVWFHLAGAHRKQRIAES
jgi:hypothetical protein